VRAGAHEGGRDEVVLTSSRTQVVLRTSARRLTSLPTTVVAWHGAGGSRPSAGECPRIYEVCSHQAVSYRSTAARLALLVALTNVPLAAAELTPRASQAYDEYRQQAQEAFLARVPTDGGSAVPKAEGIPPARPGREDGIVSVPDGLIHHWVGGAFIPNATLQRVLDVANAYDSYNRIYKEVIASKLVTRDGDESRVLIRLKASEAGIGAVLDIHTTVRYFRPTHRLVYSITSADQIREVENAGEPGERLLPAGRDSGYLWRTNSFTRFTEHDTGVYVEMETLALSRRFPSLLGWLIEPIARRLGRKSIERSLEEFIAAVRSPAIATTPAQALCLTTPSRQ